MNPITNSEELFAAIEALEQERMQHSKHLSAQITTIRETLQPRNLIKQTINDLLYSSELKTDVRDFALGMTSGYLAKKVVVGKSHSLLSELFGEAVQLIITKGVTNNADQLRTLGKSLIGKLVVGLNGKK